MRWFVARWFVGRWIYFTGSIALLWLACAHLFHDLGELSCSHRSSPQGGRWFVAVAAGTVARTTTVPLIVGHRSWDLPGSTSVTHLLLNFALCALPLACLATRRSEKRSAR